MPRRNIYLLTAMVFLCLACQMRVHRYEQILSFAMDQIDQRSLKKMNSQELFEGALDGMMRQVGDHHSIYISPKTAQEFKQSLDPKFGGLGIEILLDADTKQLTVATPLFGTPAYDAGIRPRDRILRIDSKSTQGLSLEDASELMRGKPGTSVVLSVLHPESDKPVELSIVRAIIQVDTVLGDTRNPDGSWNFFLDGQDHLGYVRITTFGEKTTQELQTALEQLTAAGMRGLVIDLRNNPGGLLQSAVEVCDLFLKNGVIVTTRRRDGSMRQMFMALEKDSAPTYPMAVLVNGVSASASEIVAACLQDHGRAKIVGQRTFGKGTVQEIIDLGSTRGSLKLTTASYWRPAGKNIHRRDEDGENDEWGVSPDPGFAVKLEADQLDKLYRWRRQHELSKTHPAAADKKTRQLPTEADRQLARAVDYLKEALAPAK